MKKPRGFYGVGVYQPKNEVNIGGIWRSAFLLDASFCFTIGRRYKHQASDTYKTSRHVPMFEYDVFKKFKEGMPKDCLLIGVELGDNAEMLPDFSHPERAVYLFGAEDNGIPPNILSECHRLIKIPCGSMNVATAASIVMYDRKFKK